jgi:hypothetical protein
VRAIAAVATVLAFFVHGGAAAGVADRPVTLLLVTDLTWATAPEGLDRFAKASLSMRSAEAQSAAPDTYLSIGKGGRSEGLGPGVGVGRVVPGPDGGLRLVDWPRLQRHDRRLHYGGTLGSVGQALHDHNRTWALASDDKDAAAVAATAEGIVPAVYPGTAAGIAAAIAAAPDAVVVAVPRPALADVLRRLSNPCTLVASASTPDDNRHLGVLAASPACGLGTAGLASPSTHHAHLGTLADVSRTFLALSGVPRAPSSTGGILTAGPPIERTRLVDADRRTWAADRARTKLVWLFVALHALGALIVVRSVRARTVVSCGLLAIPAASFLVMLVPWWRWGFWGAIVTGGVLSMAMAVGGVMLAGRDVRLGVGVLAATVAAVVGVDAVLGGPLEIDAPFGNSPVVAGRFFGVGNIGSGFLVAGLLVAGALAIDRHGRRSLPWVGGAFAAGVVAGGAPPFGADVGGILFSVPSYGLLLFGWRDAKFRLRHVLWLVAAAVAAVAVFAVVDFAREAGRQTHLARAVGRDGLVDDVARKGARAVQTIKAPMSNVILIAAAALALTRPSFRARRALRYGGYALLLAAVAGSILNDSGLNVAAAVLAVAWPAAVATAAPARAEPATATATATAEA